MCTYMNPTALFQLSDALTTFQMLLAKFLINKKLTIFDNSQLTIDPQLTIFDK